jgi:hypothetical protein
MTPEEAKAKKRAYYLANKEEIKRKAREYAAAHKEQREAVAAKWRADNADKLKTYRRERYLANRETALARQAEYRKAHPEETKAAVRRWRKNNLEYARSKEAEYAASHKEERRSTNRAWREANKEYLKVTKLQYSRDLRRKVIVGYGGRCTCCGVDEQAFLVVSCRTTKADAGYRGRPHGDVFHTWLIKNSFPNAFRLLCWNCRLGSYYNHDLCPHVSTCAISEDLNKVLSVYGRSCACCSEGNPRFLTVDHVNNDGAEHRRVIGDTDVIGWLIREDFPKNGFQILCWNCNVGKAINRGTCPHHKELNGLGS